MSSIETLGEQIRFYEHLRNKQSNQLFKSYCADMIEELETVKTLKLCQNMADSKYSEFESVLGALQKFPSIQKDCQAVLNAINTLSSSIQYEFDFGGVYCDV